MAAKAIQKIGDSVIDSLFYSLSKMKKIRINSVTLSSINNNIRFTDSTGTLTIKSNCHINFDNALVNTNFPHYVYNQNSEIGSEGINFEAEFTKTKKVQELNITTIELARDLHRLLDHIDKLPNNPPMRDKSFFSKKPQYRAAIIKYLSEINTAEEFECFRGTQRIDLILRCNDNQKNWDNQTHATRSFSTSLPIRVQEASFLLINMRLKDEFKNIVKELSENIFFSVTGEAKEQGNKEMARRHELRFHVELLKSYLRLQAFCEINLCRRQGETTKSQAKSLIVHFYPSISIPNMDLMLQRAPRIYRLLEIADHDWRFLDIFDELSPCFFKSVIKSAVNFEIWINLVRTGNIISYEEGLTLGNKEKRRIKIEIVKEYFDISDVNLEEMTNDDEL